MKHAELEKKRISEKVFRSKYNVLTSLRLLFERTSSC